AVTQLYEKVPFRKFGSKRGPRHHAHSLTFSLSHYFTVSLSHALHQGHGPLPCLGVLATLREIFVLYYPLSRAKPPSRKAPPFTVHRYPLSPPPRNSTPLPHTQTSSSPPVLT